MYRRMAEMVEQAQDLVDEVTEAVWGPVAEKVGIWTDVGRKESFKEDEQYKERAAPRMERHPVTNTPKENARVNLKRYCVE